MFLVWNSTQFIVCVMVGFDETFSIHLLIIGIKNFSQWSVKMGVIFGFQKILKIVKNVQELKEGAPSTV